MKRFYLLCVGRIGTCLGTMAFSGALPVIHDEWHIDATSAGLIQMAFSGSNAISLFIASWFSDHFGAKKVYLFFSWMSAFALILVSCFAHSFLSALILISILGVSQGGSYTPALLLTIKMNNVNIKGYVIGMMLAAGSLGYLLSVFISSWCALTLGASGAYWMCTIGTLVGVILSSLAISSFRETISKSKNRNKPIGNTKVSAVSAVSILLLLDYVAHCWELLGNWAWTPSLLTLSLQPWGLSAFNTGLIVASSIHLAGIISVIAIGKISDHFNRVSLLIFMGAAGALSSGILGFSLSMGPLWAIFFTFIGCFFILGDSGVLSAAIADNVPPETLGRIMGIRSLLGFGIGSFSPLTVGVVLDSTQSWEMSYMTLSFGGAIAFSSALLLKHCLKMNKCSNL